MNTRFFGWAVLACMATLASYVPAATIPAGTYNYRITLDGEVKDQRAGEWGSAPTYVSTVYEEYEDLSEPFEPEIDRQFVTAVNMNSGERPAIQINANSIHHNEYPAGSWEVVGNIEYYFQVKKKQSWAPDIPVPLMADAIGSVYATGARYASDDNEHGATAMARVSIPSESVTLIEVFANWQDPHPEEPSETVLLSVMPETPTFVLMEARAYAFYPQESGHEDVQAIADPYITVDWNATVNVDGVDYYATQLYELEFSPGFTGQVPEPSMFLLGTISLFGLVLSGGVGVDGGQKPRPRAARILQRWVGSGDALVSAGGSRIGVGKSG